MRGPGGEFEKGAGGKLECRQGRRWMQPAKRREQEQDESAEKNRRDGGDGKERLAMQCLVMDDEGGSEGEKSR